MKANSHPAGPPNDNFADLNIDPFHLTLSRHGLTLERDSATTLQINTGFLCNQACRHCHLGAGPGSTEIMAKATVEAVMDYAARGRFTTIDITGGAPELNSHIMEIVQRASRIAPRVMFRSNLSVLNDGRRNDLIRLLEKNRVVIVASLPSPSAPLTDAQRGDGIFEISIEALNKLNRLGYGMDGSGLELNLVSNPSGAFLPPSQEQTEKRFRDLLMHKWQVRFNRLFNLANVPLGRFREWLVSSGNFADYMRKLSAAFNPCAIPGLMCRTLVAVSWDGYLFDCDFNLARRLYMRSRKIHVSEMTGPPQPGGGLATADHCYTCTAGSGFT